MIRRDDPLVLTHAILGVTAYLARVLVLEQGRSAAEAARSAAAFCLEGILSPAAAQRRMGRAVGDLRAAGVIRRAGATLNGGRWTLTA